MVFLYQAFESAIPGFFTLCELLRLLGVGGAPQSYQGGRVWDVPRTSESGGALAQGKTLKMKGGPGPKSLPTPL